MMEPRPGLRVAARFRLRYELGRGGMGSVWAAHDETLDAICAIKLIDPKHAADPDARERFAREAKIAAQVRSVHVVQVLDHGVADGVPYLAMELLEGEDLALRLHRARRLSVDATLGIVAQVARALTKAHALGVVHRDLKPENIFLVRDADREIAKVLDFGIAKVTVHEVGTSTKTGALLGTPYYMSPEQARGTRKIDARTDLWALAVIVYECLVGERPFFSPALGDLMMAIMTDPIPVPSERATFLPPGFDAWWAKATMRDPTKRFQSARELVDALGQVFAIPVAATSGPFPAVPDPRGSVPSQPIAIVGPREGGANAATLATTTTQVRQPHAASTSRQTKLVAAIVSFVVVMVTGAAIVLYGAWRSRATTPVEQESAATPSAPPPAASSATSPAVEAPPASASAAAEPPEPAASSRGSKATAPKTPTAPAKKKRNFGF